MKWACAGLAFAGKQIQVGLPDVYNGEAKETFVLRAHIGYVGTDTKAQEKLIGAVGLGSGCRSQPKQATMRLSSIAIILL